MSNPADKFSPLLSSPVLLGGENRSGTTLLSVVLDSHPSLVVGPEIDFTEPVNLGPHILDACDFMDGHEEDLKGATKASIPEQWFDGVHFVAQCERFGLHRDDVRRLVTTLMAECGSELVSLMDRCRLVDAIGTLRCQQTGAQRWGLKLQRKIKDIAAYAAFWPNAQFIHIIRDGRDLAASHLKTVPDWGYPTVTDAAHGWLEIVAHTRQAAPAERYLEIRYEDLVTRPRDTAQRMLSLLNLPWNDALLHHADQGHSLFDTPWGHPAADAASQPLYTGRNGRYLQDLTPQQIVEFERIAGDELVRLGYGLSGQ
ncbi:sulfotransferase family protein [Zymobacter palmae]|uniref:Sulfotransferase domain superfamily n=1 Tax=Zymobacter palmae TaxID=33074 RepID=A0A348HFA7_9GAMM|nr:sulfotransferase [Zymobacter palmae]BBG30309.1 sulfotransferase domain superfamily [Zymobacter palmae]